MTHKNWDDVREERIYGYLNAPEHQKLVQAMHVQGISQRGTAVRQFLMAMCDHILCPESVANPDTFSHNASTQDNDISNLGIPTVTAPYKNGDSQDKECADSSPVMVNHFNFNDLNLSLNLK